MPTNSAKQQKFSRIYPPRFIDGLWLCTSCRARKPADDFYLTRYRAGGVRPRPLCKRCDKVATATRDRRRKSEDTTVRAKDLIRNALKRAKRNGLVLDLTVEWVVEKLETGVCEVTKLPFDFLVGGTARAMAPTIDRIDPTRGYIPGNVQVVCWLYNRAKGRDDHETVLTLVRSLMDASSQP